MENRLIMAGQEFFGIGIDTKKLEQDAERAKQAFDKIGKEAEKQSTVIDKSFSGSTISLNLEKELQRIDKMSIDAFSGISSNAQRMIKEIQEDILSLSNVEKMMSQLSAAYEKGTISQNEYINTAARLEVLHRNISAAIQDNEKALKAETVVVEKLADDSMVALQAKVTMLTTSFMKLSEAQRTGGEGEALLKNISEVQAKLNSAQVMMNKYGATAAIQFNVLGMSIQQIARELPSLTISPQMFFLAISNNLPIFTDALARARQEFQAMTAAGKDAVPVWKQVVKSLLSWQTALSLIPTLLIVYGEDIGNFFDKLISGTSKVDNAVNALEQLKQATSKGAADAQNEVVNLNLLYGATQDVTKSTNERLAAVKELKDQFPTYFKNLTDEEIMAGKAADAYTRLSQSIIASAKARAAQDIMVENAKKILENEQKIDEAYQRREELEEKLQKAIAERDKVDRETMPDLYAGKQMNVGAALGRVEELDKEIAEYRKSIYELNKVQNELSKSINIEDLIFDTKEGGKGGKKAVDNLKQYLNELLGLQEDNEERQIELTKTGTEKQIALIELRYNRQIEAVKKLQENLKKEQGGKLTSEQQDVFDMAILGLGKIKQTETTSIEKKQMEAEKKAMQEYLIEYGSYWDKRKTLAAKYQDEIARATTQGEKLSLQAEMTEALAKLDDEAQKKTSIITKLFGNMADKSVEKMREIANQAEKLLSFIEGGQYVKGNAFGITEEQFKVLSQSPEKLESIKNEIANVRAEADKAEPTFERIKDLLKKIFGQKGSEGDGGKSKLEDWLNELNGEVSKVMQSVSFLSNAFSSLGDAFGSDAMSGVAEDLNVAMGAVNSAMQGAQAGAMFGPIGAAAGAAIGVVTSLATSIAQIHDKKNEKNIQELQEQIDLLSRSYDKLGKEAEKAFSTDASNLIEQQNKLLQQQKVLIQQQIAEEKDKKKTDDARIKEWEQQLQDINEQLDENKEKAKEAITGTDVMSAIDQFAQAYADAWANGTDAAKASTDAVKSLIKTSLLEFLKKQLSPDVEKFMSNLADYMADGIITPWEQAQLDKLQQVMDETANNYFNQVGDYFKGDTTYTQTATAGGFQTMSQDSADELNGRFTALYEVGLRIENQINIGNVNMEAMRNIATETRDIAQNCYFELVEIRENTGAVVKPITQMQKDMQEMKNTIKERL